MAKTNRGYYSFTKECAVCGKIITNATATQKYCSKECYLALKYQRVKNDRERRAAQKAFEEFQDPIKADMEQCAADGYGVDYGKWRLAKSLGNIERKGNK